MFRYFPFPSLLRLGREPCLIEQGKSDNSDQGATYEEVASESTQLIIT